MMDRQNHGHNRKLEGSPKSYNVNNKFPNLETVVIFYSSVNSHPCDMHKSSNSSYSDLQQNVVMKITNASISSFHAQ